MLEKQGKNKDRNEQRYYIGINLKVLNKIIW